MDLRDFPVEALEAIVDAFVQNKTKFHAPNGQLCEWDRITWPHSPLPPLPGEDDLYVGFTQTELVRDSLLSCAQVNSRWFEVATNAIWSVALSGTRLNAILEEYGQNRAQLYANKVRRIYLTTNIQQPLVSSGVVLRKLRGLFSSGGGCYFANWPLLYSPSLQTVVLESTLWSMPWINALSEHCPLLEKIQITSCRHQPQLFQPHLGSIQRLVASSLPLKDLVVSEPTITQHVGIVSAILAKPGLRKLKLTGTTGDTIKRANSHTGLESLERLVCMSMDAQACELVISRCPNLSFLAVTLTEGSPTLCATVGASCRRLTTFHAFPQLRLPSTDNDDNDDNDELEIGDLIALPRQIETIYVESGRLDSRFCRTQRYCLDDIARAFPRLRQLTIPTPREPMPFESIALLGMSCRNLEYVKIGSMSLPTEVQRTDKLVLFPKLEYPSWIFTSTDPAICVQEFAHRHMPSGAHDWAQHLCRLGYCSMHRPEHVPQSSAQCGPLVIRPAGSVLLF